MARFIIAAQSASDRPRTSLTMISSSCQLVSKPSQASQTKFSSPYCTLSA